MKRARPYRCEELRPQGDPSRRRETLRDKLARNLEEHADEVVAAYLAGIRSGDPNRASRATDTWISRVHGRPKETVESMSAWDDPLDVSKMTPEQRDQLKRRLLAQHPHLVDELKLDDLAGVLRRRTYLQPC